MAESDAVNTDDSLVAWIPRRDFTDDCEDVLEVEREWIRRRRENAARRADGKTSDDGGAGSDAKTDGDSAAEDRRKAERAGTGDPAVDAVGLALSGGGVRSATFNLGLLQAMERAGVLRYVDYMSTVSGGGYIGSCLTWFKAKQGTFPFGTEREDHAGPARSVLSWLREHGSPMTPGGGYNGWAFGAAILTGTLVNLAIIVPLFLVVFLGLGQDVPGWLRPLFGSISWVSSGMLGGDDPVSFFALARLVGLACAVAFAVVVVFTVAVSKLERVRDALASGGNIRKLSGALLVGAFAAVVVGTIPDVYALVTNWIAGATSAISLSGVLGIAGALFRRPEGGESRGGRSLLLALGLALLCYGLFLWFHHTIQSGAGGGSYAWLGWWLGASLVLALIASINHVSMHLPEDISDLT